MFRLPCARIAAASYVLALGLNLAACVSEETVPALPPPPQAALPPPPAPEAAPAPAAPRPDFGGRSDIALLLPQSGPNAALGHDMIDAAELALTDLGSDDLALTPKDTKGTAEGAADAARSAVADGAKLIIGPLTAPEVQAVAPIAQQAGIDVLAFSNQARVAGNGVFVLGFLPQQEAWRIAQYAHSTGIDHFAVLAPSTAYGELTARAFRDGVSAAGGTVDQLQFYDPNLMDPRPVVQALAGANKPTFQAVLIPEPAAAKLKNIVSILPVYQMGQPDVRPLGTDTWDHPDLGSEPALVGGWYAAPPPDARAGFEQRFKQAYGRAPQRLATLSYDAVGIAVVLQKTPGSSFSSQALMNPSGFSGADGVFRLLPDGTTERGLAVLQVEHQGVSVVSPAPESFQAVGQ